MGDNEVEQVKRVALRLLSGGDHWFTCEDVALWCQEYGRRCDESDAVAALDSLIEERKVESMVKDGERVYRGTPACAVSGRWHDALERLAAGLDKSPFDSAPRTARSIRTALALGVTTEHEALLVLAALGYETPEGINAVLGRGAL